MTQKISILIPSYNGWHHLEHCLPSLQSLDFPSGQPEVIVIDNASTDATRRNLDRFFPTLRRIVNEENLGFAPALNRAARQVESEYLLFLNNDTRVEPDFAARLFEAIQNPQSRGENVVAACGTILDWEGREVQFFGGAINFVGKGFPRRLSLRQLESSPESQATFFPCGACMLIDRRVFLDIGGFDEDYFMIYEDVDLGWRLNLMNRKTLLVRDARVYHRESASLAELDYPRKALWWERNALWTIYKNYSDAFLDRVWPAALALAAKRNQILLEAGRREEFEAHRQGVAAAVRGLDTMQSKRHWIQQQRTTDDEAIRSFFPEPFRVWAYGRPHYELFESAGYSKYLEECLERFEIRALFEGANP